MNRQDQVLKYLLTVECATLEEVYDNVSFGYFYNWRKHLGVLIARLIKAGKVERIKPGVFKIKRGEGGALRSIKTLF